MESNKDLDLSFQSTHDDHPTRPPSMETQPPSPNIFRNQNESQCTPSQPSKNDNLLDRVLRCIDDWEQKIIDNEIKFERSVCLEQRIEESLNRQVQDGFISYLEYLDIKYVTNLWVSLSNSLISHFSGSRVSKSNTISLLLELYKLDQINRQFVVDSITELWGQDEKLSENSAIHF